MTWDVVAAILGFVVLLGAAVKAIPALWTFTRAAARVPLTMEAILTEFSPNGGGSMRDSINTLKDDAAHLRKTTHRIEGTVGAAVDVTNQTLLTVAEHTAADDERFTEILSRLDGIDEGLKEAKELAGDVKHDLAQFNEQDTLGREGRIDRRNP